MTAHPDDSLALYQERIAQTLRELGIPLSFATERHHSLQREAADLVSIGLDMAGREQRMERRAAAQWDAMKQAALAEAVVLGVVSAFRSFDYQRQIIARKLAAGQAVEEILAVSALPGFSEHHSGRALDIGTPRCPPLTQAFAQTPAYAWLLQRAQDFGFSLSYPENNPHGVIFEPWHWTFDPSF